MQIQSVKGYDPPKVASFYQVNVPNSQPVDVAMGTDGQISVLLGSEPYHVSLETLLPKVPVLRKRKYWILENRWACVHYPEWDTPLFFNSSGKRFCQLCDGKNTVAEILDQMAGFLSGHPRESVADDSIRFVFLLKKMKLISLRKGGRR